MSYEDTTERAQSEVIAITRAYIDTCAITDELRESEDFQGAMNNLPSSSLGCRRFLVQKALEEVLKEVQGEILDSILPLVRED
jgi:hypothetical protein